MLENPVVLTYFQTLDIDVHVPRRQRHMLPAPPSIEARSERISMGPLPTT
eukprot:Skav232927  [mRNA]  locus=scaffold1477:959441:959590:- [translate_table: standard]